MGQSGRTRISDPQTSRAPSVIDCATVDGASTQTVSAAWVFPQNGPPVASGAIRVHNRKITEIATTTGPVDHPTSALIPRLINLHTHLELSDTASPLAPGRPLPEWAPAVMSHRSARSPSSDGTDAGLVESAEHGVAACVDIVQQGMPNVGHVGIEHLRFLECLGLAPERREAIVRSARQFLDGGGDGLSPHAPYSVHPDLLNDLIALATEQNVPLTMHLAESPAERQLLESGGGPFRAMLERFGVWRDDVFGENSFHDLLQQLVTSPRVIIAHGNDLRRDEWTLLADCPHAGVVYCPRTHAFFGYGRHPIAEMLVAGVNVGLGTDSRASNPDLSVWNELQFLHAHRPDLNPATLLDLATVNSARALDRTDLGVLQPDGEARFLAVPLARPDATDPYEALFG